MISCAIWGGKYIRKSELKPGDVVWVSGTEQLGLLISHQHSTLAILVPLVEQEYNQEQLCTLFIHVHVPRPFMGNSLVSMTSVVWQLVGYVGQPTKFKGHPRALRYISNWYLIYNFHALEPFRTTSGSSKIDIYPTGEGPSLK